MIKKFLQGLGAITLLCTLIVIGFSIYNRNYFHTAAMNMMPNYELNTRVRIDRDAYENSSPQAGDVVIYENLNEKKTKGLGRVVGVPGNTISFTNGRLVFNGIPVQVKSMGETSIEYSYGYRDFEIVLEKISGQEFKVLYDKKRSSIYNDLIVTLQDDEFFIAGDNRDHSIDSRDFGVVNKKSIIGKVKNQ